MNCYNILKVQSYKFILSIYTVNIFVCRMMRHSNAIIYRLIMWVFSFFFRGKSNINKESESSLKGGQHIKPIWKWLIVSSIPFKRHHAIQEFPVWAPWKIDEDSYGEYTRKLLEFFSENFPWSKIADQDGCIVWKIWSKVFFYEKRVEDKREPYCPNCWCFLQKIPERAKKCEKCWKKIYAFSFNWVKILRAEEIWQEKYRIEHERNERFQDHVNSGWYLRDRLDEMKTSWLNVAIISGWWCEMCIWDRKMAIDTAYNISPTCNKCGYWYTVTWRIE